MNDVSSETEVVYNAETETRTCQIYCSWCLETNSYTEAPDEYHEFTTCAWCRHKLKVPRAKLRRLNGAARGRVVAGT